MGRLLLIIVLVLALVLAIFGAQNTQNVRVNFFGWRTDFMPLFVVILISALAGAMLAMITGIQSRISTGLRLRRQERQIAELEQKLADSRKARVLDIPDMPEPSASPTQQT